MRGQALNDAIAPAATRFAPLAQLRCNQDVLHGPAVLPGSALLQILQRAMLSLFILVLGALLLLVDAESSEAAEVLQVAGPDRLLIGDRNRSSLVRLACIAVDPASADAARLWLRQQLPRHSKVNLRPMAEGEDGQLVARVSPLEGASFGMDLSQALLDTGLARPQPCG